MMTTPAKATAIASQVRKGTGSRRMRRPASAARNGDTLISTKVLATVVRVSEAMKKKNVPARKNPASSPGLPALPPRGGHPPTVDDDEHAGDEQRYEDAAPEHDFRRC
jgi:hypothetical protein